MRILIISDTHTDSTEKLPKVILEEAAKADTILHAGDIDNYQLIRELKSINPSVYAVRGNMDEGLGDGSLPATRQMSFEGVLIGIAHGHGSPFGLENRLLYLFPDADIIVYGHTHKPFWGEIGGVYMLNPGSPTANRYQNSGSYAVLTIDENGFNAVIHIIE
ncbi:metallophosphoesterase family protein [Limisalsivibrio acetivorans]|uniref:metallophosphoesterase family protein n=1 Tax=Limisalsivibrio acetivorans TaxID=1304888 RepID=UPI0003B6434F|nr:metallophosphoesterase family protein [Limisalsivibrio acetivorans]